MNIVILAFFFNLIISLYLVLNLMVVHFFMIYFIQHYCVHFLSAWYFCTCHFHIKWYSMASTENQIHGLFYLLSDSGFFGLCIVFKGKLCGTIAAVFSISDDSCFEHLFLLSFCHCCSGVRFLNYFLYMYVSLIYLGQRPLRHCTCLFQLFCLYESLQCQIYHPHPVGN